MVSITAHDSSISRTCSAKIGDDVDACPSDKVLVWSEQPRPKKSSNTKTRREGDLRIGSGGCFRS